LNKILREARVVAQTEAEAIYGVPMCIEKCDEGVLGPSRMAFGRDHANKLVGSKSVTTHNPGTSGACCVTNLENGRHR